MADLVDPIAIERQTMQAIADAIRVRTARGGGASLVILVTAPTGSTVTAAKGGQTYTAPESTETPGTWKITVPEYGTYTVTATLNGETYVSKAVTVSGTSTSLLLPDGYTQLEYIESTGTQYIDTELSLPNGFRFVCDFIQTGLDRSLNQGCIWGSHGTGGTQERNVVNLYQGTFGIGAGAFYTGGSVSLNVKYSIDAQNFVDAAPSLKVNGSDVSLSLFQSGAGRSALNCYLFGFNQAGTAKVLFIGRFYDSVKVYTTADGAGQVARFYPALRNSDEAVGMYDTVRGQFFENAGTGAFVAGPEV